MDLETILRTIAQYYNQHISAYLAADYQGEAFQRFELPHLIVLGVTLLLALLLIITRNKLDDEGRGGLREIMAQILIINEIVSYLWLYFYQGIGAQKVIYGITIKIIPFDLINILAWLSAFMLLKKSKKLYELIYFIGMIVALYALAMPNLDQYGFPHYRFFYSLITPAIIFISAIYMTFAEENIRPYWKSLLRVFLTANIILAVAYGINTYLGSNYFFLNAKPVGNMIFDMLPDYPIYILYLEGAGIAVSLLLYFPYVIMDLLRRRNLRADTSRIDDFV